MFFLLYAITWFLRECRPWWEGIFVDWHPRAEAARLHRSLRNPHRSQRARPCLYPIWHWSRSASPLILFSLARPALYSCRWTRLLRNPCTPPPLQENHLGGGLGANAQNPRQLPTETSQLLAWAQAQGWLIDTDDLFRHIGFIKKVVAAANTMSESMNSYRVH